MRDWRRNWMIAYAVALHALWGLMLMFSDAPLGTTALGDWPIGDRHISGLLLLAVAGAAAWGMRRDRRGWTAAGFAAVLPQQFLLMLSAGTAIRCSWLGAYADGTPRAPLHILADQMPSILACLCHTGALFDWFRPEGESPRGEE